MNAVRIRFETLNTQGISAILSQREPALGGERNVMISRCDTTEIDLATLCQILSENQNTSPMKHFTLSDLTILPRSRSLLAVNHISDLLSTLPSLITLDLSGMGVGTNGLQVMTMSFRRQRASLKELRLARNGLDPECVGSLCEILDACANLERLDLSCNYLGRNNSAAAAHELCRAIMPRPAQFELDVNGNDLSPLALMEFVPLVRTRKLRKFGAFRNRWDHAASKDFRDAMTDDSPDEASTLCDFEIVQELCVECDSVIQSHCRGACARCRPVRL